jgi:hypothetical protein
VSVLTSLLAISMGYDVMATGLHSCWSDKIINGGQDFRSILPFRQEVGCGKFPIVLTNY